MGFKNYKKYTPPLKSEKIPPSFKKGEDFENYVYDVLFPENLYDVMERTHDYKNNSGRYIEASLNPDFRFRHKKSRFEFYVEVKFRSGTMIDGRLEWCKPDQLKRYQEINKSVPVFIVIGIGDRGSKPQFACFMALPKYTGLFEYVLDNAEIDLGVPITSDMLDLVKA